jgi:hypothetical protein
MEAGTLVCSKVTVQFDYTEMTCYSLLLEAQATTTRRYSQTQTKELR